MKRWVLLFVFAFLAIFPVAQAQFSGGGSSGPCSAFGTTSGTCTQGNDARLGAGAVTGAVKSNGSNTFSQAACADLSNGTGACSATYTAAGSWTPADASGASLTFTSVSANYTRIGNVVFVYGALTYPSTASGAAASINGLPFTTPNVGYGQASCTIGYTTVATLTHVLIAQNSTTASFYTAAGAGLSNTTMSTGIVIFSCIIPIT